MLRVEHGAAGDLGGMGPAGLPHDHRLDPCLSHPGREGMEQGGLARPLTALEHDEEARRVHPSVMMLLVAPLSMPSLIC